MFNKVRHNAISLRLIFLIVCHQNRRWTDPYFSIGARAFVDNASFLLLIEFYCFTEMKSKLFFTIRFKQRIVEANRCSTNAVIRINVFQLLPMKSNSLLWFKWRCSMGGERKKREKNEERKNRFILHSYSGRYIEFSVPKLSQIFRCNRPSFKGQQKHSIHAHQTPK